jgi:hypothetical protein
MNGHHVRLVAARHLEVNSQAVGRLEPVDLVVFQHVSRGLEEPGVAGKEVNFFGRGHASPHRGDVLYL